MLKKLLSFSVSIVAVTAFAAVDVNKASHADLDGLKGIGPSTSKQILAERKSREYKDWQDLMARVKGIGEAKARRLSDEGMTVNGHSYKDMSPVAVSTPRSADSDKEKLGKQNSRPDSPNKHHKQ